MAIRRSTEEVLVVDGSREVWLTKCQSALEQAGFTKMDVSSTLWQLHANYKKLTVWGTLSITLLPEGDDGTRIKLVATANVDNVYALFRSPAKKILESFKAALEDG